ncbi:MULTISPECIES: hypothetical protein [Mobiluncus]|uniref:Uncharacterized protein n=4 Tax=Mobiluncus TaxID=2050 RepID=D6ZGW4_MOBCV|nr:MULTISPECIES: hypothetical protein [Mobiluncus]ADI67872.1 hypothetical protein HMPREF0573_11553 [Mobiluncus curtisii ATCC 43063]EFU82414.1 hypothetical protein HMPREF0576_0783 [Mobiluncus holmesii ATCC 35242]EFL94401.1 hypothetical protein HMPREF0574_0352 [Mobiluncus curtisii subsp. curtisii ATCC 35241]MCU9987548.1 hypothetical protein [Mobiluncus curtisii]MCV0000377.1 hypothetical protein [Mobiluncus curtisii]
MRIPFIYAALRRPNSSGVIVELLSEALKMNLRPTPEAKNRKFFHLWKSPFQLICGKHYIEHAFESSDTPTDRKNSTLPALLHPSIPTPLKQVDLVPPEATATFDDSFTKETCARSHSKRVIA